MTWENAAVLLAVAYVVLAIRENIWCWAAALLSTAIYTVVFWNVSLVMESALNVFYMAMAVYGWWAWTRPDKGAEATVHTWSVGRHALVVVAVVAAASLFGFAIATTGAARPYVDSFTTLASVVTTFMVARKVLENWLYWVVIDAVSIWMYLDRGLESTAVLYAIYIVLAVVGWFQGRKQL